MRTLRTSVRRLVEFLLRSGDINADGSRRGDVEAMQAGSDIHRMLQSAGGPSYQAEVPLAGTFYFPEGGFNPHAARLDIREDAVDDPNGFFLRVEGRADGIIDDGRHPLTIDEIKGVSRDVSAIEEPITIHEAQALCYAYLYLRSTTHGPLALASAYGRPVVIRLTYASMTTGEVRRVERTRSVDDVEAWFLSLLGTAQRWASWRVAHDEARSRSLSKLAFPFELRDGQQEIMDSVASTIRASRRLYLQAPTGSGKTIATLYPALKALDAGEVAHVVYLTAKTMTRGPVLECLNLLKQQGITTNALVVSARVKICPLRADARGMEMRSRPMASLCNPVECPYARGHYDVANDALFEAITTCDVLDSDHIRKVAARRHVCPYELQRDAASWSDVIVCDYHYAFAPSAGLLGLADGPADGTVLLVDEAHNLAERMREMYSAELTVAELKGLERVLRTSKSLDPLVKAVRAAVAAFPTWARSLQPGVPASSRKGRSQPSYQLVHIYDTFGECLAALHDGIEGALEGLVADTDATNGFTQGTSTPSVGTNELFLALRDAGLKIRSFLATLQRAEMGYVTFLGRADGGGRRLKVYCVDPSHELAERLGRAKAAVFFSGTLLPMDYHRKLLAEQDGDASLYATSVFDSRHWQVLIGSDVSARFSRRGPELYARVARYLMALTHARPGNYLVFLPSYTMLDEVADILDGLIGDGARVVRQRHRMREVERERFVATFREGRSAGTSLVGLCVLGGIFGESIDLPGDALIGVVVVGTGMPRIADERELIRSHFDAEGGKGFAYAYTYPGMTKVLQAAGRLIRTETDRGVVLLLDDRFLEDELQEAFPREWKSVRACTLETLPDLLADHRAFHIARQT